MEEVDQQTYVVADLTTASTNRSRTMSRLKSVTIVLVSGCQTIKRPDGDRNGAFTGAGQVWSNGVSPATGATPATDPPAEAARTQQPNYTVEGQQNAA